MSSHPSLGGNQTVDYVVVHTQQLATPGGGMTEFNKMTITSACSVFTAFKSHDDLSLIEVEWGIYDRTGDSSKSRRAADLARLAINEDIKVMTIRGETSLGRAIIENALSAPDAARQSADWKKLVAGLRFDGFEILETEVLIPARHSWRDDDVAIERTLNRIYPNDVPALDFREAESEIIILLDRHALLTSKGHLRRAIQNFTIGNWAAANGQMRTFFESYFTEIATRLGYKGKPDATKDIRAFLGTVSPPLLLRDYNEWHSNDQKPQFVAGMWARMHPEGSHPGLSEEDDCAFRLHLGLIAARLFLRRFDQRLSPRV
jgi:hypothetical protein